MSETPLQMPNLNQLPDPTRDLFGGMTSPTALMALNNNQVDSIMSPNKVDIPLIKMSDEASKALQTAQATQEAINQTSERMRLDLERQYAQQEKELKKRLEERKKKQGGKIGAGIDGSFVLKSKAEELVKRPEWQGIVSDAQRRDLMEEWLNRASSELQRSGVTDETILANELSIAKNVIDGDIHAYTTKMKSDRIDPLDVVTSAGKAARNLYRGAGILFGASDKWAEDERQAVEAINSTYSDTMLLDQANYQYLRSKSKKANPDEGVVGGFIQGAKDLWNSGNVISGIVDTAGYVPYAVVGTSAVSGVLGSIGAASGASSALSAVTGGSRIIGSILSADTAGAAATSGVLAATDAAGGAYDSVIGLNFKDKKVVDTVKNNYIKSYGEANWNSLLAESGGNVDTMKAKLATQAARVAGGTAFVTTAPLGVFGLEATIAKIGSQGAAAQAGKRMLTVGANTVSETLEEGLTQYAQNVGEHPVTGVSLTDDVGANAAMGAMTSAGMAGATQGAAAALERKGAKALEAAKPTFDSNSLSTDKWASTGNINYDDYRRVIGHQFDNIARDARKIKLTEDDVQQLQQEAFNSYVDNNAIWERLTPAQTSQLKEYLALSFNVNSNPYAKYTETPEVKAWNANDAEQITTALLADNSNRDLLQAYRVKNNVELDQVPEKAMEYYKTLASVLDAMKEYPTDVNTREREAQFQKVRADKVVNNQNLTDLQKRGITMFMRNFTDAGSRRMTTEQVKAYDEARLTGTQGGSYERKTTGSGQSTVNENAGPIAEESIGVGTRSQQEASNPNQRLDEIVTGGEGGVNVESPRNSSPREATPTRPQANIADFSGAGVTRTSNSTGSSPQIGFSQNTGAIENDSGAPAQQGVTGSTPKSGEPAGSSRSIPAEAPTRSGSVGTTQTKRYPNGGSEQAIAQSFPSVTPPAIVPNISLNTAKEAFGALSNSQRKEIRKISAGGDPVATLHSILSGDQAGLTKAINATTQNKVVANRIQNAVKSARDYVLSSEKLMADLNTEQIRNTANIHLIEPIAANMNLTQANVNLLASLAADMYSEKATPENKKTLAAKVIADFAGVPTDLTYTLLLGKLEGTNRKPNNRIVNLISNTLTALRPNIIPENVESRPRPLQSQENMVGISAVLSAVDVATHNKLNSSAKRIVGRGGENSISIMLQSLLQMKEAGVDIGQYLQKRLKDKQKSTAVDTVVSQVESYVNSDSFAKVKEADAWLQTTNADTYAPAVANIVKRLSDDPASMFNRVKKNVYSVAEHVTGGVVNTVTGVDSTVVDKFLADTISASSKLGDQYLKAILKTRGGLDTRGNSKVSTLAANNVAKVVSEVKNLLLQDYINGNTETTQNAEESGSNEVVYTPEDVTNSTENTPTTISDLPNNSSLNVNNRDSDVSRTHAVLNTPSNERTEYAQTQFASGEPKISEATAGTAKRTLVSGTHDNGGTSSRDNENTNGGGETETGASISERQKQVTVYPSKLTPEERTILKEMASDYGVSLTGLLDAITKKDDSFLGVPIEKEAALYLYDSASKTAEVESFIKRITEPPVESKKTISGDEKIAEFFTANPKDLVTVNDYLAAEKARLNAIIDTTLDEQTGSSSVVNEDVAQTTRDEAIQELRELPKDANEFIAQHVVDEKLFATETPKASLPQQIKDVINRILHHIGKTVAGVSMAIALATGINFSIPNEAMAASNFEKATVSRIVSTADNNGKTIVVADKTGGTLTVYDSSGNEITSAPALFGKAKGDDMMINNATPSGRFELSEVSTVNKAYGNSAHVLTRGGVRQTNNAGNLAIHRVLTKFSSENRIGRLNSKTASDNRISHGCINVPVNFYDQYLSGTSDAVLYILPETEAGKTGIFADSTTPVSTTPVSTTPVSTTPVSTTPVSTTPVSTTPANNRIVVDGTHVDTSMDMANSASVSVTPAQIANAIPVTKITEAPVKAMQPLTVATSTPSGQIAFTAPVVLGGVTADQMFVPQGVHTPAELQVNGVFDTQPISSKEKTDEGHSIYDLAITLAGLGLGMKALGKRKRKFLSSKKDRISGDATPTKEDVAQETVDTNHNDLVNPKAQHVIKNAKAAVQKTPIADAVSRAMWADYIQNSHLTVQKDAAGNMVEGGQVLNAFTDAMAGFEWAIDDVLSDKTYEEATSGIFSDPLKWNNKITDSRRSGVSAKVMNFAAGITQTFDNLMTQNNIARVGYERDSSIPSKHLAAVKAKSSGAYGQLHKIYIKPLVTSTKLLASSLRKGYEEVEADVGRVATVKHVLNEAADAMWNGRERIIQTKQEQLEAVNANIAATPADAVIRHSLTGIAGELTKEIRTLTTDLQTARDMYNGVIEWDGKVGMPGGYTKAAAEAVLADIQKKYGEDFSKIESNVTELVNTIRGVRDFAAASGVFSNSDLQTFKDLGFTEYVPLFKQHQDPRIVDESSMATRTSILDNMLAALPASQVRAMGLNKDLSRYHREGATTPAADAFTNMKVFSNNMAGRIGSVGWINSVQQLYEGTVGKPISAAQITDETYLQEINSSYDSGKLQGLIRLRPGMEQYLPEATRRLIQEIQPIYGKGYNTYGEQVPYNYYFTEPAIQAEVYANTDLTQTLSSQLLRNVGSVTRIAARLITTFKPVWNVYNFLRDSMDRIGIALMRPVKNTAGETIGKMDIARAYFRNLAKLTGSLDAQREIYKYLTLGETNTKIQKIMHEAVGEGAINLMTSQTEKQAITADYHKSTIDRVTSELGNKLGAGLNKLGAGALQHKSEALLDFYVMRMTEVPQIITALASYLAYQELGVNKAETANRVRDQYDPTRASGKFLNNISQAFPFVRSTFSGHYNLARSLTEYWTPGQWQWTLAFNLGGIVAGLALMAMASSMFGDDEDGTPRLARLPIGTLVNGVPVPVGENGVWSLPVGFGHSKVLWGTSATLYKYLNGQQSGAETAQSLLGIVVDNTSPLQTASGNTFQENPTVGMLLTVTPLLATPIMELATNTKSFGGGRIVGRETPKDQLASNQDSFNTPETYKKWAKWMYSVGLGDHRPEEVRHLFESYMWGPLGAIPKSMIQDVSDKSLGNVQRKGEVFGPLLTAIGADMSIQTNALDIANQTWAMQDLRMKLHRKYGVGETHSVEDYENYGITGNEDRALRLTEAKLRERAVPEEAIQFILNGMRYDKMKQQENSDNQKAALKYYKLRQDGKDDPVLRAEIQDRYDKLDELTKNYLKENNHAYFDLLRQ